MCTVIQAKAKLDPSPGSDLRDYSHVTTSLKWGSPAKRLKLTALQNSIIWDTSTNYICWNTSLTYSLSHCMRYTGCMKSCLDNGKLHHFNNNALCRLSVLWYFIYVIYVYVTHIWKGRHIISNFTYHNYESQRSWSFLLSNSIRIISHIFQPIF